MLEEIGGIANWQNYIDVEFRVNPHFAQGQSELQSSERATQ